MNREIFGSAHTVSMPRKFLIVGNCQGGSLARLLPIMAEQIRATHVKLLPVTVNRIKSGGVDIATLPAGESNFGSIVEDSDLILLQSGAGFVQEFERAFPSTRGKIRFFPRIFFSAFHPDVTQIGNMQGPLGHLHSSIALYGWANGFTETETLRLYSEEVYEKLGFFEYWKPSVDVLLDEGRAAALPLEQYIRRWSRRGRWMHTLTHPCLFVMADLARAILDREGLDYLPEIDQFVHDSMADSISWPVYPEIALRLGFEGHYHFKLGRGSPKLHKPIRMLTLANVVRRSFRLYSAFSGDIVSERLKTSRYQELGAFLKKRPKKVEAKTSGVPAVATIQPPPRSTNPYRALPDYQFWRRAVEQPTVKDVDPVIRAQFRLGQSQKVATAGSCFAQHISRTLKKKGFNYYVAESGDELPPEEAEHRNFGIFSARYGNLYTARQLLQLFDRAYGAFLPSEQYWVRGDGRYADPFRPQIEPDGFTTVEELEASRAVHFSAVRNMFETLDVLVFTLGLTEAWRSRIDGAVYPLAPGVAAGEMDTRLHEFVNFGASETVGDMNSFIERLVGVNPQAKMIVTVSPVPLIATYEDRHVLVSTTYSKAVLRVAAEEICSRNRMCTYFPSYEIITGNHARGEYFESDLRSVTSEGVDHVMRLFLRHYAPAQKTDSLDQELVCEIVKLGDIVCDEEAIDAS